LEGSETLETLWSQAVAHIVRAQFVKNAGNSGRVCEQASSLAETALIIDGVELARVQHGIPVGQIDLGLVDLRTRVFELGEEASRDKVVIILIDLTEGIADGQVGFVVVGQMLFTASYGNATVRAFITDVCGRHSARLSDLNVIGTSWLTGG
jgi:hypothetical protein